MRNDIGCVPASLNPRPVSVNFRNLTNAEDGSAALLAGIVERSDECSQERTHRLRELLRLVEWKPVAGVWDLLDLDVGVD